MPDLYTFRRLMTGAAALAALALAVPAQAQGDLLVAPTRVVISGGGGAEVILSNIGSEAATYPDSSFPDPASA
ncbi:MAG TPA: hypothetical protein PK479_04470, partial [Novosphingobium sp.]|nr:hypothetical protein [Novosphingobium sp.]